MAALLSSPLELKYLLPLAEMATTIFFHLHLVLLDKRIQQTGVGFCTN
jgi:hypothetical protein